MIQFYLHPMQSKKKKEMSLNISFNYNIFRGGGQFYKPYYGLIENVRLL